MQKFRQMLQGPKARFLIIILLIPFAFLGYNAVTQTVALPTLLEIDGREIHAGELNLLAGQVAARSGLEDPTQEQLDLLMPSVVRALMGQEALVQIADGWGWGESQSRLRAFFSGQSGVLDAQGRFQPELFQAQAAAAGMTPQQMVDLLQRELAVQDWGLAMASSVAVSEDEMAHLGRLLNHKRNLLYYEVSPFDISLEQVPEAIAGERLRHWYERHRDSYREPARAALRYLSFDPDDLPVEGAAIDEAGLQAAWEAFAAEQSFEAREASHIQLDAGAEGAEGLAQELLEQLRDGADFAELAREHSTDEFSAQEGGYIGSSDGDTFPPEFEQALAGLAEGEVSEPVRLGDSLHLIRLDGLRQADLPDKGEWLAAERRRQLRRAREGAVREFRADLEERAWNALGLDELAEHYGEQVRESGLTESPYQPELLEPPSLAELRQGGVHGPYETPRGHLVVAELADSADARVRPLEEVAEQVTEEVLREARWVRALELAEAWRESMAETGDMAASMQAVGLEGEPLAYSDVAQVSVVLPRAVTAELFRLPLDGSQDGWTLVELAEGRESRVALLQLTGASPGAPLDKAPPRLRTALRFTIERGRSEALLDSMAQQRIPELDLVDNLDSARRDTDAPAPLDF